MLLSQMGIETTRDAALHLFKLKRRNPEFEGASHRDIGRVFAKAAGLRHWRWQYFRRFDFAAISQSIKSHQRDTGRPTLLSFHAIHKNGIWKCMHVAMVIGVSENMIELMDPLGGPPCAREKANVRLCIHDPQGQIKVIGSSYSISERRTTALLHWA